MKPLADLQADWPAINRLLDEVLERPPAERSAWLAALPADEAGVRDTVVRLLAACGPTDDGSFMHTLPKLGLAAAPPGAAAAAGVHPGAEVGPWRLLRELGEGGMGSVWLAERADGSLKRQVALKLPRISWARGLAERMARERDILATLEHPHIARLYDAGADAWGRPWLAMEYVQGKPIDDYAQDRALDLRQRVQLLLQVCEAVAYAHSRLVIHRDLKPSNILVNDAGQVRLLDFGIARLAHAEEGGAGAVTEFAGLAYTPGYASPEQVGDQPLSTASDVFSLAAVAYALLTGQPAYPFTPRTAAAYERALAAGAPPRASRACRDAAAARLLRGDLDAILDRALQGQPQHRYIGAEALAADLRAWLVGAPVQARRLGAAEQLQRWARRHKAPVAAGVLAVAALSLGAAVATWQALVARQQAAQAAAEADKARKEAARARATQALLTSLFRLNSTDQPDPLKAQQTTVRELLDLTARSQAEVLKDAPEARLDVLETLASLYSQLGAAGAFTTMARERVALARQVLPHDDPRRADALLSLSGRLHDTPERPAARAMLEEAQTIIEQAGAAGAGRRGALALQWARHERFSNLAHALRHIDEAVPLLRHSRAEGDAGLHLSALYFCGGIHEMAGQLRQAAHCLEEALALGDQRGSAGGRAAISGLAELGPLRERQGLLAQAAAAHDEALQTAQRLYGAVHRSTLVVAIQRARFHYRVGQPGLADTQWRLIEQQMEALQPPAEDWWLNYARSLLGRTTLERGQPALMEAGLRASIATLESSVPQSGVLARRKLLLAEVLTALGRLQEAQIELDQAQDLWRRFAAGVATPGLENPFQQAQARLLRVGGDPAAALRVLQALQPQQDLAPGMPDRSLVEAGVERAAALLDLGRPDEAVTEARRALADARRVPAPYRWLAVEADAQSVLGRALVHRAGGAAAAPGGASAQAGVPAPQRGGRGAEARAELAVEARAALAAVARAALAAEARAALVAEARAALTQAVALRQAHDAPDSLWLAQARADLARLRPPGKGLR